MLGRADISNSDSEHRNATGESQHHSFYQHGGTGNSSHWHSLQGEGSSSGWGAAPRTDFYTVKPAANRGRRQWRWSGLPTSLIRRTTPKKNNPSFGTRNKPIHKNYPQISTLSPLVASWLAAALCGMAAAQQKGGKICSRLKSREIKTGIFPRAATSVNPTPYLV